MSFEDAKSNCSSHFNGQGRLFEPREANLDLAVSNKAKTVFSANAYWIGITKSENTFQYANRDALTLDRWDFGQPDNSYSSNRCVEVQSTDIGEVWNNVDCNKPNKAVCEKGIQNISS